MKKKTNLSNSLFAAFKPNPDIEKVTHQEN